MSEDPAVTDTRDRSERPSSWTRSEKIIALVLVILLSTAAAAYVGYYSTRSPPVHIIPVCSNGGVNYPSCNTCLAGQSLVSGSCINNCTNGANNPPSCNNTCSNGATNPPACNNPCPNGASNPACTIFKTTTSLSCNPSSARVNDTHTTCTATVTDTTIPTGTVVITCPDSSGSCNIDQSADCTLSNISGATSRCRISLGYSGPIRTSIIVYANYKGDSTHLSSIGQYNLTIISPPINVTISGSVTTGDFSRPNQMEFQNTKTNMTYDALVSSGYTISLPNFETYKVTIHYNGLLGSGTCDAGTLHLRSYTDILARDFRC